MSTAIRVSQAASLAVHTMALLANDQHGPLSAREIAAILHVSEAHLAKVLARLAKEGLVSSTRGPGGGFVLADGAGDATLMAVYEAIDGKFVGQSCLFETPLCREGRCIFGDLVTGINDQLRHYLSITRISDIKHVFGADDDQQKHH